MRHSSFDIALLGESWQVNGQDVEEELSEFLFERSEPELPEDWGAADCVFCKIPLLKKHLVDFGESDEDDYSYNHNYVLRSCARCAYWNFQGSEGDNTCDGAGLIVLAESVASKFDPDLPLGCEQELAQHLRRYPEQWAQLTPKRMETFVADIFRANYKNCEVIHVGKPGDRGVDVLFIDDNNIRWLIQVKRRSKESKAEEFATLQRLLGTLVLMDGRHGIIVSNADHFSYQACADQEVAKKNGYVVEFIDKGKLDRMLEPLLPQQPWKDLLTSPIITNINKEILQKIFT